MQDEYFVVESTKVSPNFGWDESSGQYALGRPVGDPREVQLKVSQGNQPTWSDYHEISGGAAISEGLVEALEPLDLYGVEYVPAQVRDADNPFNHVPKYWLMHVWNRIACLDRENSDVECSRRSGRIFSIDRLVLRELSLKYLELRKRMIFCLTEKPSTLLVHKSLKEAMESVGSTGIRFFPAIEWNNDVVFD